MTTQKDQEKKFGKAQEKRNVIPLVKEFSHLSVADLENILEWLEERKYLSETGKVFRNNFWSFFIKK